MGRVWGVLVSGLGELRNLGFGDGEGWGLDIFSNARP